jgi:cytochrome P450
MSTYKPAVPELIGAAHMADPWPDYAVLRDHYPILWHEPTQSWVISRYEHIRPLVRDKDRFTHEYTQEQLGTFMGNAQVMTALEGKAHASRRALVTPFLVGAGLERFAERIEERARTLMLPLIERERERVNGGESPFGELDLVAEFSSIYPVDVIAEIIGLPSKDYEKFQQWYRAFILCLGNIGGDAQLVADGLRAKDEFGEYIMPLIAERRKAGGGDDLITSLCRTELDGQKWDDEDIRTFLSLMLLAGGETTDHQFADLVHALITHPDQLEALVADRSLIDAAMAEGMRYCAIVQFIQREAREDYDLDGVTIKADQRVTLLFASGNRDPRRWEEPDRFNMFRGDHSIAKAFTGNAEHLGFGGGRHVCLGMHLSRTEVEKALGLLLDHTSNLKLADGFAPTWSGNLIRAIDNLELTFTPT